MFVDHSGCKSNNLEEQKYQFSLLLKVHRSKKIEKRTDIKKQYRNVLENKNYC